MPDPIAIAINRMLNHIHTLDKQIESMQEALNNAGIQCQNPPNNNLDGCKIKD
jgi:serine O-acetyltransferase